MEPSRTGAGRRGVISRLCAWMLLTVGAILPAAGQQSAPAGEAWTTTGPVGPPSVTVSGSGEVRQPPDEAAVRLGVSRQARAAQEAQSEASAVAQRILEALGKLGVKPAQIQTSQLTLLPVYERQERPTEEPPRVVAYRASNLVTVRLDRLMQIGPVIDAAVSAGANEVEGIDFQLKNDLEARERALREAVAEARRKASAIASALNMQLAGVLEVEEAGVTIRPPLFRSDVAMARMEASTPVSPGEVSVTANVNVRYQLRGR